MTLKAPPGKWLVSYGVHQGTIVSRDSQNPTVHDSEAAARAYFNKLKAGFDADGYRTWFAELIDAQGGRTVLAPPVPY